MAACKRYAWVIAAGGLWAVTLRGQTTAPAYQLLPHSDSFFARELSRMQQRDAIAAELQTAKGTAAENLWKAERIVANWEELAKDKAGLPGVTQEYLAAVRAYLQSQTVGIDGAWALAHVKFIFARLAERVINRMEYWGASEKDRAELRPMADAAALLLKQAGVSVDAGMKFAEGQTPFDEPLYMRNYNGQSEAEYDSAWVRYFQAMTLKADGADGKLRAQLLHQAIETLKKWADDGEDNGVNNQALLLRGKAHIEAGETDAAMADFAKADNAKAPEWLRYQARYQMVVAKLRSGDFTAANGQFEVFKKSLGAGNPDAQINAAMLQFRILWSEAEKNGGGDQKQAKLQALALLGDVIQRDPRYRDLIYQQLVGQIPEKGDVAGLFPMQELAVAYTKSQGQRGDTPESRKLLTEAVAAATAVRGNASATATEKLEATFLAGVCDALLNNLVDAARFNIEFAEAAPKDPRARTLTDLALEQIGELRKIAGADNVGADVRDLQERALALATQTFHDEHWYYAQARTLEDLSRNTEAATMYEQIPEGDKNYLDARYRLILLATKRFSELTAAAPKASEKEIHAAANAVFQSCDRYIKVLDHPPAGVEKESLDRAKTYRPELWLIETATALDPAVKETQIALDRLGKLEAIKAELLPSQQGAVLRYRIQAYQLAGDAEKALAVVKDYAAAQGKDATAVIQAMAYSTLEDINKAEKIDPAHARQLAHFMADLLASLVKSAQQDPKVREHAYDYQKLQSDMLLRAGQFADAKTLALSLEASHPEDLFNYMTEARATFEQAKAANDAKGYAVAEDLFSRILPKVTNGSESFWECWLRIFQTKEAIGGKEGQDVIRKRMADLKAGFGEKLGGETYKQEFSALAAKYAM